MCGCERKSSKHPAPKNWTPDLYSSFLKYLRDFDIRFNIHIHKLKEDILPSELESSQKVFPLIF